MRAGDKGMKACESVCRGQRNENMSACARDKGMKTCECVCVSAGDKGLKTCECVCVCVRRGQRNENM